MIYYSTGVAAAQNCTVQELIFSTPRLIEYVGRQLPHKPDLLHELADLVNLTPRALALVVLPRALPQLFAKSDRTAIEAFADQAGVSVYRMLCEHGHHVMAASLMTTSPRMDDFVPLTEEMTGKDFMMVARLILGRTVTEMVVQTGAAQEWNNTTATSGTGASLSSPGSAQLPAEAVHELSKMLALLASTVMGGESQDQQEYGGGGGGAGGGAGTSGSVKINPSEFLAEGDHVTRMLKEFGDELERRLAAVDREQSSTTTTNGGGGGGEGGGKAPSAADLATILSVLRRILILISLTGPFVGRFLPQFMVLLGAAVRPQNHKDIKLQGLVGWKLLAQSLSVHAPVQLGGIVNQVVVTLLEGLQEGGLVGAAAARVVEDLIAACKVHYPEKIRSMPPIPARLLELRHVNGMLQEARGNLTIPEHVELLLESLSDEALSVRSTALQELRAVLANRRDWIATLNGNHALQMRLLGALLKAAEPGANSPAGVAAQQACAECLGMLGAIDPSRVKLDSQPHPKRCTTEASLAVELLKKHLVRLLKTAPNLQTLDCTTLAIQEVLRSHVDTPELRELYSKQKNGTAAAAASEGVEKKKSPSSNKRGGGGGAKTPQNTGNARGRSATPQLDINALFSVLPEEMQAIVCRTVISTMVGAVAHTNHRCPRLW